MNNIFFSFIIFVVDSDLSKNRLTRPIPDFASLKKLQILNLVNNRLSGSIPATLSSLSSLKELYLANNQLEGEIPPSLLAKFKAGTLNFTDLSKNQLTGPIPDFASLKKLQILNLVNNRLSGSIPATLSSLSSLKELYLANNQLEGEIPPSLLAKFKAGTLNFTYGGNTKLKCSGASCDLFMDPPTPPPPPPIVSSPPRTSVVPSPSYATLKTTSTLPVYVILIYLLTMQAL
ncbi:hypothetical protein L7F22_027844 [Adiantum nelumboides]|nr:hypothetical protein [Adiantum nelumboides]